MKTRIPPLLIVLLLGGLMLAADRYLQGHFEFPGREWLGVILVVIGIFLTGLGVHRFRAADTTVDPRYPEKAGALVTTGIYRHTRNPMYLGFAAVLLGWTFFLGSAPAFAALPIFVLYMNAFQIAGEEAALEKRFGKAFEEYRARVRRWI
jgi:protein-S-isoprenylcysteine O-methyltransferase Ste14